MEYLIDTFNSEFKTIKKESFLTSFGLLSSIIFYSKNSRLNSQLLSNKVSDCFSFDLIKCQYYSTRSKSNNLHTQLNQELTLSKLIEFIREAMLLKIETEKGLYKDKFACQIPIKENIVFIVSLDIDNTYLILQLLLDSFTKLNSNLINLKVKFDFIKDKISKYNSRTNAVKGFSFYYTADNYFITIDEKQMIEIQEISSWSNDTDSSKKINIEADILLNLIENNDSHKFHEIIAKH